MKLKKRQNILYFLTFFNPLKVERHSSGHSAKSGLTQQCVDREEASRNTGEPYEEVHVYAERGAEVAVHRQFDEGKV